MGNYRWRSNVMNKENSQEVHLPISPCKNCRNLSLHPKASAIVLVLLSLDKVQNVRILIMEVDI